MKDVGSDKTDDMLVAEVDRRLVEDRSFVLERVFALRVKIFDCNFVEAKSTGKNTSEAALKEL